MNREELVVVSALMHQIAKIIGVGAEAKIEPGYNISIQFDDEDKIIDAAKEFGEPIICIERNIDLYRYRWSFTYNGVEFYCISEKEYKDAKSSE